jgi:ABC-type uncharacterized transport system permease subunit
MEMLRGPVDRRLWLGAVVAIVAIAAVGILVSRSLPGHSPSPIGLRLAAALIVTVLAAVAKFRFGPRAAAVAGVAGTFVAVVLLIALA